MNINNSDEALRARDIAMGHMKKSDFRKALSFALKAQRLDSKVEKISQMIMVCEVNIRAEYVFPTSETDKHMHKDYYGILNVEPEADVDMIKKQYKKLALVIHPDKNDFPGAHEAFQFINEAHLVLTDGDSRMLHDLKRRSRAAPPGPSQPQQTPSWRPSSMRTASSTAKNTGKRASSTAKNTGKRKRHIFDSSSSSDADDVTATRVKREFFVILSDDDDDIQDVQAQKQAQKEDKEVKEDKQKQKEDVQEVKEDKQTQEENVQEVKEDEQTQEEDAQEVKEDKQTQEENVQEVKEDKQKQKEDVEEEDVEEEDVLEEDDTPTGTLFYDASDFSDFDKLREKKCFQKDQLWAVYDEEEGMPRYYAIITEVTPVDFMLKYAWLEVDKDYVIGRPKLPVSVGKFEVGDIVESDSCANFSHLVCSNIERRLTRCRKFTVYPKKGETWALFKNWNILIESTDSVSPSMYEYEYVEILSDHVEGTKISVGFLSKVEDYRCVFCPMPNGNSCDILPHEFCRFSHSVPSFRLTGTEGPGVAEGFFELDPAALPV